jgi:tRNA-specific 2-thiouridylase
VQLRAHGEVYRAACWLDDGALRIRLHNPARGVARGQAAVLYEGTAVLGSATIASTVRAHAGAGSAS